MMIPLNHSFISFDDSPKYTFLTLIERLKHFKLDSNLFVVFRWLAFCTMSSSSLPGTEQRFPCSATAIFISRTTLQLQRCMTNSQNSFQMFQVTNYTTPSACLRLECILSPAKLPHKSKTQTTLIRFSKSNVTSSMSSRRWRMQKA